MLKIRLVKYRYVLLAIVSTFIFIAYFFHVFKVDYTSQTADFQQKFTELESGLDDFLSSNSLRLTKPNWKKIKDNKDYNLHIYHHDSVVFWNTNQLPINRFADIHFPAEGIIHLQNGWYYAKIQKKNHYTYCGSFLIKHDYSYENKDLKNSFVHPIDVEFEAAISLEQLPNASIFSEKNTFLFSLVPSEQQIASESEAQLLLFFLLISCILWLIALVKINQLIKGKLKWVIPVSIVVLRFLALRFNWFGFMQETQAFQATLYGTNEWLPNFFEYLLNCLLLVFIVFNIKNAVDTSKMSKKWRLVTLAIYLLNIPFWVMILYLNKGLIENSSIPLTIERPFSLNFYSLLAILSIGALFYSYYVFCRELIRLSFKTGNSLFTSSLLIGICGIAYFFYEYFYGQHLVIAALFPFVFNLLTIYFIKKDRKSMQLGFGLSFLVLFSLVASLNLAEFNRRKEKSERELFASQLATEQDIVTEVEFSTIHGKINDDRVIQKIIESPGNMKISDFEAGMERRLFNGFWERYEMNFNLFDEIGKSLIDVGNNQKNEFESFSELIQFHGQVSEIDSSIYFISDYTNQYSYIARIPVLANDSIKAYLFCTFKSKKIPEEIGFPRLLISEKAQVFASLERYSIAKYHKDRLVTHYGKFNFPSSIQPIASWKKESANSYDFDGYNHFILDKSKKDVIVLSSKNVTWIDLLTSFSYLFSFYGILLLPFLFQFKYTPFLKRTLSLAVKIQLVLIGLVFLSLLAFGWGSGVFVKNQYNEFTDFKIREKLSSVELELRSKLGNEQALSISKNGNYTEYLLQNFSKVFVTDINLYDPKGFLIASSRPKVFNYGLLSEQINPTAIQAFKISNKSEFVHNEQIGDLQYASAYRPFYNHDGVLLGYLNLQHFGQQDDFENQIQQFLVAIINVFMLLLAISIVIAIFISNWVTAPLRLLQENFANLRFGKHNQQISYDKEDEIGALVKNYNQKLEELEFTAQQLAQSERESAWREMAKQVAHEIKNPLTPMKLSIQQLLRVYNPDDPKSEEKLTRVATSIIEQIDALTKIANEFSNFAKMPRPDFIPLDLVPVLENVVVMFKEEENCTISIENSLNQVIVLADKDQLLRVFNNLIKNAIQAIPEDRFGKIDIHLSLVDNMIRIAISDNGAGISQEKRQHIFVPYFTTKTTGTGLGLAMVKQIVENHNGQIYFEENHPEGTTFFVELPLKA